MRLVIQIPCRDEADSLAVTIAALPTSLPEIDDIRIVVIDDGSTDDTAAIAAKLGAHVVRLGTHRGLAQAFMTGLDASLAAGADIIVNTDGDNQYHAGDIGALLRPLLAGTADIAIGARPIRQMTEFSPVKKLLQRIGSWTVRRLSGAAVQDATCGFRAMTRDAALRLNVFSRYTYTLETIVQAAHRGLRISSVPVRVNPPTRPSRLVRSNVDYMWRTGSAMLRILVVYSPFRSFMLPAVTLLALATAIGARFLYYFIASGGASGHTQSLILAAILFGLGGILMAVAFLGDLLAINRQMLEELRLEQRRARLSRRPTGGEGN